MHQQLIWYGGVLVWRDEFVQIYRYCGTTSTSMAFNFLYLPHWVGLKLFFQSARILYSSCIPPDEASLQLNAKKLKPHCFNHKINDVNWSWNLWGVQDSMNYIWSIKSHEAACNSAGKWRNLIPNHLPISIAQASHISRIEIIEDKRPTPNGTFYHRDGFTRQIRGTNQAENS